MKKFICLRPHLNKVSKNYFETVVEKKYKKTYVYKHKVFLHHGYYSAENIPVMGTMNVFPNYFLSIRFDRLVKITKFLVIYVP